MRNFIILILFYLCIAIYSFAADTTRVLFIGNSFTYVHEVPVHVKGLAEGAGFPLEFTMHAPGGITVGDLDQGTQAHMNNPLVFDLIRQGNWDYVVLQDNQGRFVYDYGLFPPVSISKVVEGHLKILDSVRFYNSCAKMILFAGWAFEDGQPPYGNTGAEMIDRIYANYTFLNDTMKEIIAPIGLAWNRSMTEMPAVNLWGPDGAHQSLAGSYITAAAILSTIYRMSAEEVNYDAGMDSVVARTMRRIAFETVRDSVEPTSLASITPVLTVAGSTITASAGYDSYRWYKDGVLQAENSNVINSSGNGCYYVGASDDEGCGFYRSFPVCIGTTGVEEEPGGTASVEMFPNPASQEVRLRVRGLWGEKELTVYDAMGRSVYNKHFSGDQFGFMVNEFAAGVYYVRVATERGQLLIRQLVIRE